MRLPLVVATVALVSACSQSPTRRGPGNSIGDDAGIVEVVAPRAETTSDTDDPDMEPTDVGGTDATDVHDAGDALEETTTPDSAPVPPPHAPPTSFQFTAGGGAISSPGYRLQLFIAPSSPVGRTQSQGHRLTLGPATNLLATQEPP